MTEHPMSDEKYAEMVAARGQWKALLHGLVGSEYAGGVVLRVADYRLNRNSKTGRLERFGALTVKCSRCLTTRQVQADLVLAGTPTLCRDPRCRAFQKLGPTSPVQVVWTPGSD